MSRAAFVLLFYLQIWVACLCRNDEDDSVSRMKAAEEALVAKQKVMCCISCSLLSGKTEPDLAVIDPVSPMLCISFQLGKNLLIVFTFYFLF